MKVYLFSIEGTINGNVEAIVFGCKKIIEALTFFKAETKNKEYKDWCLYRIGHFENGKLIEDKKTLITKIDNFTKVRQTTLKEEKERIDAALKATNQVERLRSMFE